MSQSSSVPFNVKLLELTTQRLAGLRPVTKLDIFDGAGTNFAEDGLFSVSIFGKLGDERRSQRFSFIDIKIPVFHPVIYRALVQLKTLYGGILAGTDYAVWDPLENDFQRSDQINGKTGFAFFVEHWLDIDFQETKSTIREYNIKLVRKYAKTALTSKVVVMPAGYRDVEILPDGRVQKDELNNYYAALIGVSNTISSAAVATNHELLNTSRLRLQRTFNALYESIESMLEGKKKLIMDKWASRRIQNGTRNVITAMDTSVPYLGAPGAVGFNNTVVGLYQLLKALLPVARYHLRYGYLQKVFVNPNSPVRLINKKTLHQDPVSLDTKYFDRWTTDEGLEKVITSFREESLRLKPLEIDGRYLGLLYTGPDGTFKILEDIDQVPHTRSKADVRPMTLADLLYLSTYRVLNRYPIFVTRYPVTGVGSIYPSKCYAKTTIKSERRRELDEMWEPMDDTYVALEFPTSGPFVDSLVPHVSHLSGLGADKRVDIL